MNAGFASPAYDKYHRNSIDFVIQKRCDRIDDVALTRILHINDRNLACGKMVSCGQCRAVALICGNDMMVRINSVCSHQIVAESLKLTVRYSRIKISAYYLNKFFNLHSFLLTKQRVIL